MSGLEGEGWVQLGVAGALQQEYQKDQHFFFELLAKTLQSALPEQTELKMRGFLKKSLSAIDVDLGEYRYVFERPERGSVLASRSKIVRGIALKTEELQMDQALLELSLAIEQQAAKSAGARQALASMLGLD